MEESLGPPRGCSHPSPSKWNQKLLVQWSLLAQCTAGKTTALYNVNQFQTQPELTMPMILLWSSSRSQSFVSIPVGLNIWLLLHKSPKSTDSSAFQWFSLPVSSLTSREEQIYKTHLLFFSLFIFILCVWVFYQHVCQCTTACLMPVETRKGHQISWDQMIVKHHAGTGN